MPEKEIITYALKNGEKCSCEYYRTIPNFAGLVVEQGERLVGGWVDAFLRQVSAPGLEAPRTRQEYVYDLLTLGVLWRMYARDALAFSKTAGWLLKRLTYLREKYARWKKVLDAVRGPLMLLLIPYKRWPAAESPTLSLKNLERLITWLSATGRFDQESKRLQLWRKFFAEYTRQGTNLDFAPLLAFAAWFESQSSQVLGCYTAHVEQFLVEKHPHYRGREDYIFCGRRPVEYHLQMLGTEILNQALREQFQLPGQKAVLVPPCMRAQPDERCQAEATALGARCTGCTPNCSVHQLTKLGEKHGFAVFMLPDDLRVFSTQSVKTKGGGSVGVIGVSCALTNGPGGWQAREMEIPAQGVLLDYCGCIWHWHKQGIPTNVNFHQLLHVLGIQKSRQENHHPESIDESIRKPSEVNDAFL